MGGLQIQNSEVVGSIYWAYFKLKLVLEPVKIKTI